MEKTKQKQKKNKRNKTKKNTFSFNGHNYYPLDGNYLMRDLLKSILPHKKEDKKS